MGWTAGILLGLFFSFCPERVETLVITNPADASFDRSSMSGLAPWVAWQKKGLLLFTNEKGDNVRQIVDVALKKSGLERVEHVIFVGSPRAIPLERRKNPLPGKDEWIETEPLAPLEGEPFSFSVGRIFHEDPAVVHRMLCRACRWEKEPCPAPKAMVASNPGGGLQLLETFSRGSALELKNAGFEVAAFFGPDCTRSELRRLIPDQTLFLYEGHHSTLIRDYEAHLWKEPLSPSLIILQSCLALSEDKAGPFLERGALAVVGSSTRTYSGSGGALALSYLDALVHEKQTLGQGLRHAKNFLLAFAKLKEQRLGEKSTLGGANLRTAWAFTLWGDPTLRLPLPAWSEDRLPGVSHEVRGKEIIVHVPEKKFPSIRGERFEAALVPNLRLGGLLVKREDEPADLVPLVFREIHLPPGPEGMEPRLKSKLSRKRWVFLWDARRQVGYLLLRPADGAKKIRFQLTWGA